MGCRKSEIRHQQWPSTNQGGPRGRAQRGQNVTFRRPPQIGRFEENELSRNSRSRPPRSQDLQVQVRHHTRSRRGAVSALAECEHDASVSFMSGEVRPLSLESPAESQFHTHDAIGVANPEQRDAFSERIFKLYDLVLR